MFWRSLKVALAAALGMVALGGIGVAAQSEATIRVETESATVLSRRAFDGDVLATVPQGTVLDLLGREGDWYWVLLAADHYGTRRPGWVYIRPVDPEGEEKRAREEEEKRHEEAEKRARAAEKAGREERAARAKEEEQAARIKAREEIARAKAERAAAAEQRKQAARQKEDDRRLEKIKRELEKARQDYEKLASSK
jgi:flagellar biosynthesis GTPase FlhF